ncbi:replication protein [Vreelandella titanicae]|uniref:replication protein n=1 Tax=Vreelandella titanicae TaxID=664683 RepID=UPI0038208D62
MSSAEIYQFPPSATGEVREKRGPQVEDGYTRIANELLEQVMAAPLTLREIRVVMAVVRLTYGWSRKHARVTGGLLAKLTGLPGTIAAKVLSGLIAKNVILRHGGSRSPISLNKHADEWRLEAVKHTPPAPKLKCSESEQNALSESEQNALPSKDMKETPNPNGLGIVQNRQSDRKPKGKTESSKIAPEIDALFDKFWESGLPKVGKKPSREKFARLAARQANPEAFTDRLLNDIKSRLDAAQFGFDKLHPNAYLNQQRWEDELPERCPHAAIIEAWNAEMPAHIEKVSPEDWTPDSHGFQALANAWQNFKTKPRASTGKPVFTDEPGGVDFYRQVFRRLAAVDRIQREDAARWCRLSWAVKQQETVKIFKGEVA